MTCSVYRKGDKVLVEVHSSVTEDDVKDFLGKQVQLKEDFGEMKVYEVKNEAVS